MREQARCERTSNAANEMLRSGKGGTLRSDVCVVLMQSCGAARGRALVGAYSRIPSQIDVDGHY